MEILVPNKDGSLQGCEARFIQSLHYTRIPDHTPRPLSYIVIHCTENSEVPNMAEMNARLFSRPDSPQASFHYVVDNNSIFQCVRDEDVAWHAPGCNHNGIGIEIVGRASQSVSQWADEYSRSALYKAVAVAAHLCLKHNISPLYVNTGGILAAEGGITTHADVTKAFPKVGHGHTDPGVKFPMETFVYAVQWMGIRIANPTSMNGGRESDS